MGEITTVSTASTKSTSLRTTIPKSVVMQLGLSAGDKLDWAFEARDGALIVVVRAAKG